MTRDGRRPRPYPHCEPCYHCPVMLFVLGLLGLCSCWVAQTVWVVWPVRLWRLWSRIVQVTGHSFPVLVLAPSLLLIGLPNVLASRLVAFRAHLKAFCYLHNLADRNESLGLTSQSDLEPLKCSLRNRTDGPAGTEGLIASVLRRIARRPATRSHNIRARCYLPPGTRRAILRLASNHVEMGRERHKSIHPYCPQCPRVGSQPRRRTWKLGLGPHLFSWAP